MTNLFAYTEQHSDYPAYVSVNKDDDGRHRISVRSAGNGGVNLGEMYVSPETLEHLAISVLSAISGDTEPFSDREAFCKQINKMVNRFLGWKLPENFCPDAGISFKPTKPYEGDEHGNSWWPVGTNLLTAEQARAMFEHCLKAE